MPHIQPHRVLTRFRYSGLLCFFAAIIFSATAGYANIGEPPPGACPSSAADFDGDGWCDDFDNDDDGDGAHDKNDTDSTNPKICSDVDKDGCDDCSSGTYDLKNDGEDSDNDGLCDAGDPDKDGDGIYDATNVGAIDGRLLLAGRGCQSLPSQWFTIFLWLVPMGWVGRRHRGHQKFVRN